MGKHVGHCSCTRDEEKRFQIPSRERAFPTGEQAASTGASRTLIHAMGLVLVGDEWWQLHWDPPTSRSWTLGATPGSAQPGHGRNHSRWLTQGIMAQRGHLSSFRSLSNYLLTQMRWWVKTGYNWTLICMGSGCRDGWESLHFASRLKYNGVEEPCLCKVEASSPAFHSGILRDTGDPQKEYSVGCWGVVTSVFKGAFWPYVLTARWLVWSR